MRLWVAGVVAAAAGAVVAGVVLAAVPHGSSTAGVMPPASPGAAVSAGTPMDGDRVSEPNPEYLPVGPVRPGYGSTRSGVDGVPLGFAHSADGAAAAATAWLSTVEGSGVLDAQRRREVLAAIGDAGFGSAASGRLADRAAALGLDASGQPAVGYVLATVWASRGAYRVVSSSDSAAQVEIWYLYQLGVVPPGGQPTPGQWRRATLTLRWDPGAGDWRLSGDFRFADGPDPQTANPSPLERAAVLARVGTGWRLYADAQQ